MSYWDSDDSYEPSLPSNDEESDYEELPQYKGQPYVPQVLRSYNFSNEPIDKLIELIQNLTVSDYRIDDLIAEVEDTSLAYAEAVRQGKLNIYGDLLLPKVKTFKPALEAAAQIGDMKTALRLAPLIEGGLGLVAAAALGEGQSQITEDMLPQISRPDIVLYGAIRGGNPDSVRVLVRVIDDPDVLSRAFAYACANNMMPAVDLIYKRLPVDDKWYLDGALFRGLHDALLNGHEDASMLVLTFIEKHEFIHDMGDELALAIHYHMSDMIERLLPYAKSLHQALDQALILGNVELAERLLTLPVHDHYIIEHALYKALMIGVSNFGPYISDFDDRLIRAAYNLSNMPVLRALFADKPDQDYSSTFKPLLQTEAQVQRFTDMYDDMVPENVRNQVTLNIIPATISMSHYYLTAFLLKRVTESDQIMGDLLNSGWFDLAGEMVYLISGTNNEFKLGMLIKTIFNRYGERDNKLSTRMMLKVLIDNIIKNYSELDNAYYVIADSELTASSLAITALAKMMPKISNPDKLLSKLTRNTYSFSEIKMIAITNLISLIKDTDEELAREFVDRIRYISKIIPFPGSRDLDRLAQALEARMT